MKSIIKTSLQKILTLIENPIKQTNWYKRIILDKENYPTNEWYRKHEDRNFDIVNLGSSSALYAFDYSDTDLKAFNWALQPQSLEYSFKVLQNFFSILKPDGIVVIPLGPFSGLSIPEGKWSTETIDRYFGILDSTLIDEYHKVAYRRNHPLLSNPKMAIKRIIRDVPPTNGPITCTSEDDFKNDAKKWINNWMEEFKITNLNATLTELNISGMVNRQETLRKMIDFCQVRSLKAVIVIPPVHSSLSVYFESEFKKNYISNFIDGLQLKDILYLDWLHPKDCPFRLDDSDFINSLFLNKKGAQKFTSSFLSILNERYIL